jgi:hypothetical protein
VTGNHNSDPPPTGNHETMNVYGRFAYATSKGGDTFPPPVRSPARALTLGLLLGRQRAVHPLPNPLQLGHGDQKALPPALTPNLTFRLLAPLSAAPCAPRHLTRSCGVKSWPPPQSLWDFCRAPHGRSLPGLPYASPTPALLSCPQPTPPPPIRPGLPPTRGHPRGAC